MAVKTHAELMLPGVGPGGNSVRCPGSGGVLHALRPSGCPGSMSRGGTLVDRKGWRMIWSDARFGPVRQRLLQVIRATGRKESSS